MFKNGVLFDPRKLTILATKKVADLCSGLDSCLLSFGGPARAWERKRETGSGERDRRGGNPPGGDCTGGDLAKTGAAVTQPKPQGKLFQLRLRFRA